MENWSDHHSIKSNAYHTAFKSIETDGENLPQAI